VTFGFQSGIAENLFESNMPLVNMFLLGKSASTPSPQSQASRWYPSAPSSNQPSLATPGVRTGCWLILAFPFKDLGAQLGRNGQKPSGWKKQGFVLGVILAWG